jgi:hypothetical protein
MGANERAEDDRDVGVWRARDDAVRVEVRNRLDGSWSRGFEIVEQLLDEGGKPKFRVRRISDGYVLPAVFSAEDVTTRVPLHRPGA